MQLSYDVTWAVSIRPFERHDLSSKIPKMISSLSDKPSAEDDAGIV